MQQGASAYAKVSQATLGPRDLEAHVLIKAASRLQGIVDNWEARRDDLDAALTQNRKLWTVLSTAATENDNPLPAPIKQNIANLAVFIFKRTFEIMAQPEPAKLASLIHINRELAAGLRAIPSQR